MHTASLKAALALAVAATLVIGLTVRARRRRTTGAVLQLVGALCFAIVAIVHVFEALAIFPSLGWGQPRSVGHYVDLGSAVVGAVLLTAGVWSDVRSPSLRRWPR